MNRFAQVDDSAQFFVGDLVVRFDCIAVVVCECHFGLAEVTGCWSGSSVLRRTRLRTIMLAGEGIVR